MTSFRVFPATFLASENFDVPLIENRIGCVDTSCKGTYIVLRYIFHTYILHLLEKLVLLEVLFSLS